MWLKFIVGKLLTYLFVYYLTFGLIFSIMPLFVSTLEEVVQYTKVLSMAIGAFFALTGTASFSSMKEKSSKAPADDEDSGE